MTDNMCSDRQEWGMLERVGPRLASEQALSNDARGVGMMRVGRSRGLRRRTVLAAGKVCFLLPVFFIIASMAFGQGDPLKPSNMPVFDQNCADYPANVWVTGPLFKLRQDSGTPPTCPGTYANKWYIGYGTQNEFVDFQVHWHDTGSGTTGLKITISNFVQASPNSYTINCATLGQCVVYREAYVNVQKYPTNNSSSRAWNTYYGVIGYYPDILVPAVDPYWGQTTNAWPFTVAAGKNQSAWIDVLIPQAAPAGYYQGTVTVQTGCPSSCTTVATLPIVLAVWQWPASNGGYMPSTTTLTMVMNGGGFGWNGLTTQMYTPGNTTNTGTLPSAAANYPGGSGSADAGQMYAQLDAELLLKDHRMSGGSGVYNTQTDNPASGNFFTGWSPLNNGTCNLHNGAGTTCPILPGSKSSSVSMQSSTQSATTWINWYNTFNTNGWGPTTKLFNYLVDEPANCNYVSTGNTEHGYINPGIPNLVTTDYPTASGCSALNTIDWMVVLLPAMDDIVNGLQNLSNYRTWAAGSSDGIPHKWMSYWDCVNAGTCTNNNVGPGPSGNSYMTYPNFYVDGLPVANRAMEWMTYFHGQTGELYFSQDLCTNPYYMQQGQCVPSGVSYDPWNGIYSFGCWGDGTGLYVSSDSTHTTAINYLGTGVTTPIILPSMRMKNERDGVQDYEYLFLLNSKGQTSLISNAVSGWITNSYTFNVNPTAAQYGFTSDLTDARNTLGTAIHKLTYPTVLQPPPTMSGTLQ